MEMKYLQFADAIEHRIHRGDYVIRQMPTEDELAREAGVSRKTVRRGVLQLVGKGLLSRKPNGRLEVRRVVGPEAGRFQLAFLAPAFNSPDWQWYRLAAERTASKLGVTMRSVDYVHWDDPIILDVLANFDGIFLIPSSAPIPPAILERLGAAHNVVVLDTDLSRWNIPSVELMPPIVFQQLAEHLYSLGHRHIDCLNTQPHDEVMIRRIKQWELWQQVRKVKGRLIDTPVKPYEDALSQAHATMGKLLDAREFNATALICLTESAAAGAARAFYERGLRLGKDVSLCASDGSRRGRFMCPSLTVIELPEPEAYLEVCLGALIKRDIPWPMPLLIQPPNIPLFVGESTGPAPA